ncbi:MAG TPA: hypothetical protein VFG63_05470 [Nocardioidaceae bacterium]|nr:hypothetical protein [Nocardioidaceae bacterium]
MSVLLRSQAQVARVQQLVDAGLTRKYVRSQVDARRWQRYGDHCIITHNHIPTRRQRMWLSVLEPVGPVCLGAWTALETAGFRFFGEEQQSIHVLVQRGNTSGRAAGVTVHESRRFSPADIDPGSVLPRTPVARSALDAGAWQPSRRYACGVLAAVVQQKLCTVDELFAQLQYVGRVRHKSAMRLALHDIAGGAEALSELDIATMCRRFGIRPPDRQRIRRDRHGRKRYLDCEWVLADGSVVVLEVDGGHHFEVQHWEADVKRERGVVVAGRRVGRIVLRATAHEARYDQAELSADLEAIGVPRLVRA